MSSPLYDLFASIVRMPPSEPQEKEFYDLDKTFLSSEVFVSTNVTEYYYAGTDQEVWLLDKHFPNLAPVFDSFWIETKAPTHIRSAEYGVQPWTLDDSFLYKRPKRWGAWFLNGSMEILNSFKEFFQKHYAQYIPDVNIDNCWIYAVTLFTQGEDTSMVDPMWSFTLLVDKTTGKPVRNPHPDAGRHEPFLFASNPSGDTEKELRQLEMTYGREPIIGGLTIQRIWEMEAVGLLKPLLLALSFMHCRNVTRVPEYPSAKLNKKRVARNLPPMNKFHTLNIEPMRRIIQQALDAHRGAKGSSGIEMAMHSVIGHFKTYTPEKPLMGHAVGTWFWGGIQRGSKKRGTVTKERNIVAP